MIQTFIQKDGFCLNLVHITWGCEEAAVIQVEATSVSQLAVPVHLLRFHISQIESQTPNAAHILHLTQVRQHESIVIFLAKLPLVPLC